MSGWRIAQIRSYIPVYGPLKYNGLPLDIQLYVFEIDDVKQFKPLLQTLTKAGQNLYPPASPVLGLLDSLGSALLSGAKNDKMFEYTLCLWPRAQISGDASGFESGSYPVLEAGHYVFARSQDRKFDGGSLVGELQMSSGSNRLVLMDEKKKLYSKDSYLVLHVKRESYALSLDDENAFYKTFAAFKQTEAASSKEYADKISGELSELGASFVHNWRLKGAYTLFTGVSSAIQGQEAYVQINATKLLFDLREQIKERTLCDTDAKKECASVMTKAEIEEFLAMMKATKAFGVLSEELTYEGLVSGDVSTMVKQVVGALPQNATDTD